MTTAPTTADARAAAAYWTDALDRIERVRQAKHIAATAAAIFDDYRASHRATPDPTPRPLPRRFDPVAWHA